MELIYTQRSGKDLKKLPKAKAVKILKKINQLTDNPHAGNALTGEFVGLRSLKIWPYRVIYQFNHSSRQIIIITIRHHQEAYK